MLLKRTKYFNWGMDKKQGEDYSSMGKKECKCTEVIK